MLAEDACASACPSFVDVHIIVEDRATLGELALQVTALDILVIDDDKLHIRGNQRLLEGAGHTVVIVGSGEDGLAAYRAAERPFNLVMVDLRMPGMSGEETPAPTDRIVRVCRLAAQPGGSCAVRVAALW